MTWAWDLKSNNNITIGNDSGSQHILNIYNVLSILHLSSHVILKTTHEAVCESEFWQKTDGTFKLGYLKRV